MPPHPSVPNPSPRRARMWAALKARPRLLVAVLFGVAAYFLAGRFTKVAPVPAAILLGWNAGTLLYLALSWQIMRDVSVDVIRQRAIEQDEGRMAILALVLLSGAAVLLAVSSQV